ncbi:MAG: hypothetical protein AAF327_15330 [Cyanobacteria bacterium P01_A01_bin.37]
MLLLSLMLHGLLVFIPVPSTQEKADDSREVSIQITPQTEQLIDLNEASRPEDAQVEQAIPQDLMPEDLVPEPTLTPPLASNHATQENVVASNETLPPLDPSPLPERPTNEPLPFSQFPHLSGGEVGCYGLDNCHQIQGGNFRQIGNDLTQQIEEEGFEVRFRDDLEDAGIKVYEVTQDDTTQYLSVLQPELGRTVYILAAEPVTSSQLQTASSIETQFEAVLRQISNGQKARATDFPYPEFFFEEMVLRSEITGAFHIVLSSDRLAVALTTQLATEGFTVSSVGDYAGAPFYEVSQGAFLAYLSVLPTRDSTATLLVSWNRLPE